MNMQEHGVQIICFLKNLFKQEDNCWAIWSKFVKNPFDKWESNGIPNANHDVWPLPFANHTKILFHVAAPMQYASFCAYSLPPNPSLSYEKIIIPRTIICIYHIVLDWLFHLIIYFLFLIINVFDILICFWI